MNIQKLDQKGSSLVFILILAGIVAAIGGSVASYFYQVQSETSRIGIKESILQVKDNVIATLDNEGAWYQTVLNNPSLACLIDQSPGPQLACPAGVNFGVISVFDAGGTAFLPNAATSGFTASGISCNTFGIDRICVFQYQIIADCLGGCLGTQTVFHPGSLIAVIPSIQFKSQLIVSPLVASVKGFNLDVLNTTVTGNYYIDFTRGGSASTLSKFCSTLTGSDYSQSSQVCEYSIQNPKDFDCEIGAAGPSFFMGYAADGIAICQELPMLNTGCPGGTAAIGVNGRGGLICGTF